MMVKTLEELRYNFFWLKQKLTGNRIANHLDDISTILGENDSYRNLDQYSRYLDKMLSHSAANSTILFRIKSLLHY